MRVGLLAGWTGGVEDPRGLDALAVAERAGFDGIWLTEAAGEVGGALLRAAALAQLTERIRLGVAGPPPPALHPLRLAEDLAMIDLVSGGRLDWIPIEGDASRAEAETEAIEIVLRAWRGEAFAHVGRHHAFDELVCLPRPHQRPHPPLWLPVARPAPDLVESPAPGRWIDDLDDLVASRDGGSRALICRLSPAPSVATDGCRHSALRGGTRAVYRAVPSLAGDPDRARETLATLIDHASPDWLILEPDRSNPRREEALDACFRFVDEVVAG